MVLNTKYWKWYWTLNTENGLQILQSNVVARYPGIRPCLIVLIKLFHTILKYVNMFLRPTEWQPHWMSGSQWQRWGLDSVMMTVSHYHLGVKRLPASFRSLGADTPLCMLSLLLEWNKINKHILHQAHSQRNWKCLRNKWRLRVWPDSKKQTGTNVMCVSFIK